MTATFHTKVRNTTIIQCYAPTEAASFSDKEHFYSKLNGTLSNIPPGNIKILLGDFNAKVGGNNTDLIDIMGKHGIGTMNENGELFTEMCNFNNLAIGGTLFPHKRNHKITWVSPDGHTENQIDHICISKLWRRSLLDVRNKRSADIASDHHLLLAEIRLKITRTDNRNTHTTSRLDVQKLRVQNIRLKYCQQLQMNIANTQSGTGVDAKWAAIKDAFLTAGNEVLGNRHKTKRDWISHATWEIIDKRRSKKADINRAKTRASKALAQSEYEALNKSVKRLCRRDKRAWISSIAAEAEAAASCGNSKLLYECTKRLSAWQKNGNVPIKAKDGRLLTAEADQLSRWYEHFVELFNVPNETPTHRFESAPHLPIPQVSRISSLCPSIPEIEAAIQSMKNGKAAGIDNVNVELFKADPKLSARILQELFQEIWETETFPTDWLRGTIVKIPKKGALTDCNNWRGIMILCSCLKIFCKIILTRIEEKIDVTLRRQQAGFRSRKSCVDHIATLRIIIEQINELHESLHLVFIDFQKAFDLINHQNIWEAMSRKGVPPKICDLIKAQYQRFECSVRHGNKLSSPIPVKSGVRQGCVLSPLLFLIVIDEILTGAIDNNNRRGIVWHQLSMEHLNDLVYADDVVLISKRQSDMQSKIDDIDTTASKYGLKINADKTKALSINAAHAEAFTLYDRNVEAVTDFTYLGSQITPDGGARADIPHRIKKAKAAFASLYKVWRSKQINNKTKIRLFKSNVLSVLLYGCETWLTSVETSNKLQTFINRSLRYILRIWWPENWISNVELYRISSMKPIVAEIRERKWRWIGHVLRNPANDLCRQAFDWNPQGTRRRGRPRGSWRRSLETEISSHPGNLSWNRIKALSLNRNDWNNFVKALCAPDLA